MNEMKIGNFEDFLGKLRHKNLFLENNENLKNDCNNDIEFLEAETKSCSNNSCIDEKNVASFTFSNESEPADTSEMESSDNILKDSEVPNSHCIDSSKIYVSCRFCREGFETLNCFEAHRCKKEKIDSSLKLYKCKFCSLAFSRRNLLNRHVRCHKRNNCTVCNAQFTKRKALCKHLRNVHNINVPEKIYNCSFCSKYFSNKQSLNFHLRSHAEDQYLCLKCGFMCDDKESYDDHVKIHIKISKHECKLCGKKFVRRQQYDQHMSGHERHSCSPCNITFSTKKLLFKHQRSVHHVPAEKKHACPVCQKLFLCPKLLQVHERIHSQEKPVTCSHCDKSFSNSASLSKHMKTIRHLQRASEGKVVEIEKRFLCSGCGARFYGRHSLRRHVEMVHADNESLKCPHCEYNTKCKTNLKRHIELHSDVKRFVCEICGLSFRAFATLKQHHAFVHSSNREFICDLCAKGFKNNSTLQRHMRIHSENRPYKCSQCDNDYKRMSHLKRHMVSAHHVASKRNQISIVKESTDLDMTDSNMTASLTSSDALSESLCDDSSFSALSTNSPKSMELNGSSVKENALGEQLSVPNDSNCTDLPTITIPTFFDEEFSVAINNDSTCYESNINYKTPKEQLSVACENDSLYTNAPTNTMPTLFDEEFSIPATLTNSSTCNKINDSNNNPKEQLPLYTSIYNFVSNQDDKTSCTISNSHPPLTLDDDNLNVSSNEQNFILPSSPLENTTLEHSIISRDVLSFSSPSDCLIRPHSLPNLNFQANSPIDSFANFALPNSDLSSSVQSPPFLLPDGPSSPSRDLNGEQNHSSKDLFGDSDDILSLHLPYSPNSDLGGSNCSSQHFLNSAKDMGLWDIDENSNVLKLSGNDVAATSSCANSSFSTSLSYNSSNILIHNLFSNDPLKNYSLESIMNPELEAMLNLC